MSLYSALTQVLAPFAARIKGIQTGYDGTEYNSPGEAVREQINDLHVLIGDTPGTAIQASAVAYNDSNVGTELTALNGRLAQLEEGGISGSGMNDAAIYYLQKVLESALFKTDASADIQTLVNTLKGQDGIVQDGETITVNYLLNDTATASAGYVTIT